MPFLAQPVTDIGLSSDHGPVLLSMHVQGVSKITLSIQQY